MSYVIYNTLTTRYISTNLVGKPSYHQPIYATRTAAKAALTRAVNNHNINRDEYDVADLMEFDSNIEKKETKINLRTGVAFTQSVNTPSCCDPSTEIYHQLEG